MRVYVLLGLFLYLLSAAALQADFRIKAAVQVVTPGAVFPEDSYSIKDCQFTKQYEPGYLTNIGIKQLYFLGRNTRSKYIEKGRLLPQSFETHTMFVRSVDSDRAIASAYSFLAGLYPPQTGPMIDYENVTDYHLKPCYYGPNNFSSYLKEFKIPEALPSRYQPIPVHTKSMNDDYFFSEDWSAVCPKLGIAVEERLKSKRTRELKESLSSTVNYISEKFKRSSDSGSGDSSVIENAWDEASGFVKYAYEMEKLGCYINDQKYQESQLDIKRIRMLNSYFRSPEKKGNLSLVTTSKIIGEIARFFKETSLNSQSDKRLKFFLFSTEFSTLLSLLMNLDLISTACSTDELKDSKTNCVDFPQTASSLMFELLEDSQSGNLYAGLNYDGKYFGIGCEIFREVCPLSQFLKFLEKRTVDLRKECFIETQGNSVESESNALLIAFLVFGAIIFLMVIALFLIRRRKKWRSLEEMELKSMERPKLEDGLQAW